MTQLDVAQLRCSLNQGADERVGRLGNAVNENAVA
jgi:hypothetical protein